MPWDAQAIADVASITPKKHESNKSTGDVFGEGGRKRIDCKKSNEP
jgi:hypothetical protein